jgi:peptidoglycan hydrolase-like protein with peptidoglycan-binding domain
MAMIPGYKTTATLRTGSKGEPVKQLQYRLHITADGIFGSKTKAAVQKFQKSKKLSADGIAGKQTLTALGMYGTYPVVGPKPNTPGTTVVTPPKTGGTTTTSSGTQAGTGGASALPGQMLDKVIGGVILFGIYKTFQKIF